MHSIPRFIHTQHRIFVETFSRIIIRTTIFCTVTGDPIEVGFERSVYTVNENVGDNNLALLVCVNASSVATEFTVTLSTENGTAIGNCHIYKIHISM